MTETIGLIAAMALERDALLRCIEGGRRVRLGTFRGHAFEVAGQACLLSTSGMGIRRAAQAARTLVEAGGVQMLVSFGIAGAVEADLEIGDVVAAESVCRLEQGEASPRQPLAAWPPAAREAIAGALSGRGARLFTGTAVTTGGSQFPGYRAGDLAHPVLEMETVGIVQVAAEKGLPLLSLRAISDGPRAPIPIDINAMMDEDANLRLGRLLAAVIRRPGIVLQARQMMRNTGLAAENAARALVAALEAFPPAQA